MSTPQTSATSAPAVGPDGVRLRVGVELELTGDLRYLSHHDEMRMLARAFVRARWPIAYSQGYNPIPRLTLPLPRSVGMASDCDLAIVELSAPENADALRERLIGVLPGACRLRRLWLPMPKGKPHARGVTYEIPLDDVPADLPAHIERTLAAAELPVMRSAQPNRPARQLDIRPYVHGLELIGTVLRLSLRVEQQQTARPAELLARLGLTPEAHLHRLVRREVEWDMDFDEPDGRLAPHERNDLGNDIEDQEEDKGDA